MSFRQEPYEIRVIRTTRAKSQRITDDLQRQLAAAFTPLRELFTGWDAQAAVSATRIGPHGDDVE
jgi:hypothetical protein